MFKKFKPDMDVKSVYDIDFDDLYNEGIKGIIFDIDNTLVAHDAPYNDQSDELVQSGDESMPFQLDGIIAGAYAFIQSFRCICIILCYWKNSTTLLIIC